jgi:hypothetical protein
MNSANHQPIKKMKKNHILRPILAMTLLFAISACSTTTHVIPVRPYVKSKPVSVKSDAPENTVFQGPRGGE